MPRSATPETFDLQLRIWGARGSIPTPAPQNLYFGGNTACIDVRTPGGDIFLFDCGTGIRNLGLDLARLPDPPCRLHIFLSHFHWDHLQGLPFFLPLYNPANEVIFYSAHPAERLEEVLSGQMATPYFPVNFELLAARRSFVQLPATPVLFGDTSVTAFPVHHPQGAWGYRISRGTSTIVYATDHEHGNVFADRALRHAAMGADILLYDSQFTPEEYPGHTGWGHSTWLEATSVALDAGVKRLLLFHHDPGHDDDTVRKIVAQARLHFPATDASREGSSFTLNSQPVAPPPPYVSLRSEPIY